jgi:MFS family permease
MKRISVLMFAAFVDMLGFAIIFPLLPYYALRMDAQEWMVGWLIASFSIAKLASAPWWGRLSDRYGRRPIIITALSTSAIAFFVFGFASSLWVLFLSRVIQGLGGGTTGVLQAYIGDAFDRKDRTKALGWLTASTSAGVMIGPAIGSLAFGFGPATPGLVAGFLCVLNVAFAWKLLPESTPPDFVGTGKAKARRAGPTLSIRSAMWQVLKNPGHEVSLLIWIYTVGILGFISTTGVLVLYLQSDFAVTETTIGLFFVYVGAMGVVMRALVLGKLVDWLGEIKVMRLGAILLMLGILLITIPDSIIPLAIIWALIPIGTACLFPAVAASVTHRVSDSEFGQSLGVQQAFGGVARVIGPIWATAVYQGVGAEVPFVIASGIVAVSVVLTFLVHEHPDGVTPAEVKQQEPIPLKAP